jgi:hypothetical protein
MVSHSVVLTPHEMLKLATRLEHAAHQIEQTTVFSPAEGFIFGVGKRREFAVIEGGKQ